MKYQLLKKLWISATFIVFLIGIAETYSIINNVKSISNESQIPSSNPNVKPPNVLTQNIKSVSDVTLHASGLHQRLRKRDLNIGQGFRTIGKATAITGWSILYLVSASIKVTIELTTSILMITAFFIILSLLGFVILIGFLTYFIHHLLQSLSRTEADPVFIRGTLIITAVSLIALVCATTLSVVLLPVALVTLIVSESLLTNHYYLHRVHVSIENQVRKYYGMELLPLPVHIGWIAAVQIALQQMQMHSNGLIDSVDRADDRTGGTDGWLSRYENRWDIGETAHENTLPQITVEQAEAALAASEVGARAIPASRDAQPNNAHQTSEVGRVWGNHVDFYHVISPGNHHSIAVMAPYIESTNSEQSSTNPTQGNHWWRVW